MSCESEILKYFKSLSFNYHFDDNVPYGKLHPITSQIDYSNHLKEMKYGDMIDEELLTKLSNGLPDVVKLHDFIGTIYDQKDVGTPVSCCISYLITIRANYLNYQRYRIVKFLFGDKVTKITPSVSYMNWNANIQSIMNKSSKKLMNSITATTAPPSIYSHLIAVKTHKIIDISKYEDSVDRSDETPDLNTFYYARKSPNFLWNKIKQDSCTLEILLNDGLPIICAIVIYKDILGLLTYQWGLVKTPNIEEELPLGSIPIVLIGYSKVKKIFYFVNTWSERWGDNGVGEISYDYILNSKICGDFAILDYEK
jgi:hypothetical protein